MKDERVFKIRRNSDGLFLMKKGYGVPKWKKTGSMWRGIGPLKLAIRYGSLRKMDLDDCMIVVYKMVVTETGILPWSEINK